MQNNTLSCLYFFAFLPLVLFAPPVQASCIDFLIPQKTTQKNIAAKGKLERVIEAELVKLGFQPTDDVRSTFFTRFKMRALAAHLDAYNLSDENYRNIWIEKLIDLKISENLSPIDDFNLSLHEPDRKALGRIILRSLAKKGTSDLKSNTNPTVFQKIKKNLRNLRAHPLMRGLFQWRLTFGTVTLSENQILSILRDGESAISSDPNIQRAISKEKEVNSLTKINKIAIVVAGIFLLVDYFNVVYPSAVELYNTVYAEQVKVKTIQLKTNVSQLGEINSEQVLEHMALNEKKIILDDFRRRWGGAPTGKEHDEINFRICEKKFGGVLTSAAQSRCKAL